MTLNEKVQEIIDETQAANLPPLKEQSLEELRKNFLKMSLLQGEVRALPKIEGRIIKTKEREIPLRLYYPKEGVLLPMILYFHSGGYVRGSLESHDTICRELAFHSGCLVIAVGYSLAPENPFPSAIDDGERALFWAYKHSIAIMGDKSRIALCGDSSGGNLVCALTHRLKTKKGPPVRFQVLIYPQVDYTMSTSSHDEFARGYLLEKASLEWYSSQYVPVEASLKNPEISPLWASDFHGLPPALIITAECDPLRDEAELYADKLKEAGTAVTCHRYEGMVHGFFQMAGVVEEGQKAIEEVGRALHEALT